MRTTRELIAADKCHQWHPFTQMRDWCAPDHEPLVLVGGQGAMLRDSEGREYLDGNSSIWTNIHGHGHSTITTAIREQAGVLAHASFLGATNPPAIELGERLVSFFPGGALTRVFFSDDGSTAMECALKMALQYRQLTGDGERCAFAAFDNAYHGDTLGASALGGVATFAGRFQKFGFPVHHVASVGDLEKLPASVVRTLAAVTIEPLIQGAAGMRVWPPGMLRELRAWCDRHGVHLILDEVMTGFGRTGEMFACQREGVVPDFIALAKGLTGGTMPLAATLTTEIVYGAFLGGYAETFFYGHSYTGNPLGCAAALASLRVFEEENTLTKLQPKIAKMGGLLEELQTVSPHIGEVRQCGFIAGIDLVGDGQPLDWRELTGVRVCQAARAHGLLTRPVRDTVVLMPPLCTTEEQLAQAVGAIGQAVSETLP